MFGGAAYCPTQRLHGSCWTLTELGESCAQRCGGASLVDRSALSRLSSTAEVASHLEQLYGIQATSKDAIDRPCGDAGESLYVFVPHGFTNYGGEGRWHCSLVKVPALAVSQLGSSGRAWWLWATQHSQ